MSKNKAISFLIQNCCFLQAVPRKFIFNQNGSTDITQFEHRCPKQLVILCALTFSTDDEFYWRQESKVFPGFSTASRQTASAEELHSDESAQQTFCEPEGQNFLTRGVLSDTRQAVGRPVIAVSTLSTQQQCKCVQVTRPARLAHIHSFVQEAKK
jgi:hypothetical protein